MHSTNITSSTNVQDRYATMVHVKQQHIFSVFLAVLRVVVVENVRPWSVVRGQGQALLLVYIQALRNPFSCASVLLTFAPLCL